MTWDPFGTIASTLWIGGGQWCGKSTVARILASRLRLTAYHCDYANANGHIDRHTAAGLAAGTVVTPFDAERVLPKRGGSACTSS